MQREVCVLKTPESIVYILGSMLYSEYAIDTEWLAWHTHSHCLNTAKVCCILKIKTLILPTDSITKLYPILFLDILLHCFPQSKAHLL